jgi:hypothetical protein
MLKPLSTWSLFSRWGRRTKSSDRRKIAHRRLGFEALEPRQLLSAQSVWFSTVTDAAEPSDAGSVVVMRNSTEGHLVVNYYGCSGTATSGVDYQSLSGTVIIPSGSSSATISVVLLEDTESEVLETVDFYLRPGSSSSSSGSYSYNYDFGSTSCATVTISDDDVPPTVSIHASHPYAYESGPDTGEFVVERSNNQGDLTVIYWWGGSATSGQDYQGISGSVKILDGATSATITVAPFDDSDIEDDESVEVYLSSSSSYTLGGCTSATVTIVSDDVPRSTVSIWASGSPAERGESGYPESGEVVFYRSTTQGDVTIYFEILGSATNGTDYESISSSVTIYDGSDSTAISIRPYDDSELEGNEAVQLSLLADSAYEIAAGWASLDILDDEGENWVTLRVDDSDVSEVDANPGTFIIERSGPLHLPLSLYFELLGSADNGNDYEELTDLHVEIPANESSAAVTIVPIDDSLLEDEETVELRLLSDTASPAWYSFDTSSSSASLTIVDRPTLDLATDSNNDGYLDTTPDGDDDAYETDSSMPGKLVAVADTLSKALVRLRFDSSFFAYEELQLDFEGDETLVRVWDSSGNQINSGDYWLGSDCPTSVYLEGLTAGSTQLSFFPRNQSSSQQDRDELKVTFIEVDQVLIELWEQGDDWTELPATENVLVDDWLRWSAQLSSSQESLIERVEWQIRPMDSFGPWTPIVTSDDLSPAEFALPLGDWDIQPLVYFQNGAVAAPVAETPPSDPRERGFEKLGSYRATVRWEKIVDNYVENDPFLAPLGGGDGFYPEKDAPGDRSSPAVAKDYGNVYVTVYLDRPVPPRSDGARRPDVNVAAAIEDPTHYVTTAEMGMDNKGAMSFLKWTEDANEPRGGYYVRAHGKAVFNTDTELHPTLNYPRIRLVAGVDFRGPNGDYIWGACPTDNYIAVVGSESMLSRMAIGAGGSAVVWQRTPNSPVVEVPDGNKTSMLSVVRTLYVERDHMGTPDLTQGPDPSIVPAGMVNGIEGNTFKIPSGMTKEHTFSGGKITLKQGATVLGTYDVVDSVAITPDESQPNNFYTLVTLGQPVPAGADSFINLCDDDVAIAASAMAPDLSLLQTFLAPAFIRVNLNRTDLAFDNAASVNQDDVTFSLNVGADRNSCMEAIRTITGNVVNGVYQPGSRQSQADPRFWCAYILGAYQGQLDADADHTSLFGGCTPGITTDAKDRSQVPIGNQLIGAVAMPSLVFRETLRDWVASKSGPVRDEEEVWKLACVHEVLHQLGLFDPDTTDHGGIMNAADVINANIPIAQLAINEEGLRRIREVLWPGQWFVPLPE